MPFWDECFHAVATDYPDVRTDQFHIDILTAHFVRHPDWFDVVVGSNLFGDILSDLGPAVVGSIASRLPPISIRRKEFPSMFEPVHGSAPDIAGKGIANPIGQIWSGAMMLRILAFQKPRTLSRTPSRRLSPRETPHPRYRGQCNNRGVGGGNRFTSE